MVSNCISSHNSTTRAVVYGNAPRVMPTDRSPRASARGLMITVTGGWIVYLDTAHATRFGAS